MTADGKANVYYQTKQEHILCLAAGPRGVLYAGTDKGGLVYRIDPPTKDGPAELGKGFILYHTHQSEVRSLLATPEAVYAGTSSPTRRTVPKTGAATTLNDKRDEPAILAPEPGKGLQVTALTAEPDLLAQGAPPPPVLRPAKTRFTVLPPAVRFAKFFAIRC